MSLIGVLQLLAAVQKPQFWQSAYETAVWSTCEQSHNFSFLRRDFASQDAPSGHQFHCNVPSVISSLPCPHLSRMHFSGELCVI